VQYDASTGRIVRWGSGRAKFPRRRGLRVAVVEDVLDPLDYRVEKGALVPLGVDTEAAMRALRDTRDQLLAASDWSQLPDAPCDRAAWAEYRQALRDLPETTDPLNPKFPDKPRRTK
jgi:hypothetical protein